MLGVDMLVEVEVWPSPSDCLVPLSNDEDDYLQQIPYHSTYIIPK